MEEELVEVARDIGPPETEAEAAAPAVAVGAPIMLNN
jgi:hypothetical protein